MAKYWVPLHGQLMCVNKLHNLLLRSVLLLRAPFECTPESKKLQGRRGPWVEEDPLGPLPAQACSNHAPRSAGRSGEEEGGDG